MNVLERYLRIPKQILACDPPCKVESFIILYVKMETQMRKLVTFTLRVDPHRIHWNHIVRFVSERKDWDLDTWKKKFNLYSKTSSFETILGTYLGNKHLAHHRIKQVRKLKTLRDGIFHGVSVADEDYQIFRESDPNQTLITWINDVAEAMEREIGYDGIDYINRNPVVKSTDKTYRFNREAPFEQVKRYVENYGRKHY